MYCCIVLSNFHGICVQTLTNLKKLSVKEQIYKDIHYSPAMLLKSEQIDTLSVTSCSKNWQVSHHYLTDQLVDCTLSNSSKAY